MNIPYLPSLLRLLLICFVLQGCQEKAGTVDDSSLRARYVKGTVTDEETGLPVDSARIRLASIVDTSMAPGPGTYTDRIGHYLCLVGATDGSGLLLVVERPNYESQYREFRTSPTDTAVVNFRLVAMK